MKESLEQFMEWGNAAIRYFKDHGQTTDWPGYHQYEDENKIYFQKIVLKEKVWAVDPSGGTLAFLKP